MQEDQAIAEIRELRRPISEECDHDPRKPITSNKELRHKDDCCDQKKINKKLQKN
jgi:hypothetical protein